MPGYEVASSRHFFLLFVKIDHIAVFNEARPDPVECALMCEKGGCDGVTIGLHNDDRYIQDTDVRAIREAISGKLNIEVALSNEIEAMAKNFKPHQVTIVPQERAVTTTGNGLDVRRYMVEIRDTVKSLQDQGIVVSLLIGPDPELIERSKECGADFIEIDTSQYCSAVDKAAVDREIARILSAANHAVKVGLKVSAGRGLNYYNITPVLYARALEQVHVGRAILRRSLTVGLPKAVEQMIDILD